MFTLFLLLVIRPAVFIAGIMAALALQAGKLQIELTPEIIAGFAGIAVSLLFSYVPGFATWYGARTDDEKRGIMLLAALIVTAGAVAMGCYGLLGGVDCSQNGILQILLTFVSFAVSNQTTHGLSPRVGLKAKKLQPAILQDPDSAG